MDWRGPDPFRLLRICRSRLGAARLTNGVSTLLADLGTLTKSAVCFGADSMITVLATPTVRSRTFQLVGADLAVT